MSTAHFDDPAFVARYTEGPGRFVPGYQVMQRMAGQLIAERIGDAGNVLVLGAGGGLEIEALARAYQGWRFTGVDPAQEMLKAAQARAEACGAQAQWVNGYVFDAPEGPFDAATCMLTLHFVADDGGKLETLRALRQRLKPDAPFVLVDLCIDIGGGNYDTYVERYRTFALQSGADPDDVARTVERVKHVIQTVSAERDVALLAEAGFNGVDLFFAGHSWRGWVAYA